MDDMATADLHSSAVLSLTVFFGSAIALVNFIEASILLASTTDDDADSEESFNLRDLVAYRRSATEPTNA
jgi:hypothetical protein